MSKQYFWLKLQKKFFSSYEIKIIMKHEKGAQYVIFWQKLLLEAVESIDRGVMRYKENIPYTPEILSTITDTDVDTVKGALQMFSKLDMIKFNDDGDLFIDEVIQEMIGRISDEGIRKAEYRKKIKQISTSSNFGTLSHDVPKCPNNKELELELEKDIEKEVPEKFLDLATFFYNRLMENVKPSSLSNKKPDMKKWASEFRKLAEIDGQPIPEIIRVIDWTVKNEFWKSNILSPKKLREKFDKLEIQSRPAKSQYKIL